MASPPPSPSNVSSLLAEAEALSKNTGVLVMLVVSIELLLVVQPFFPAFFAACLEIDIPTDVADFPIAAILTAILPLQTALVGYANKDAANQEQALMAISAVAILSLSHQSNWMVNTFSWKGLANVVASSASIIVSASAVLFNTGFHGHYKRIPVYAFVIVIFIVEAMSAVVIATDMWSLRMVERRRFKPSDDSNADYVPVGPQPVKNLIEKLQKAVLAEDAVDVDTGASKAGNSLASLLMNNRDYFQVTTHFRDFNLTFPMFASIVYLSLMAVAAADTHGFERIVLSFCAATALLRGFVTNGYLLNSRDHKLPELCQEPYGLESALGYFCKSLSAAVGEFTDEMQPALLEAWYEAHRRDNRDIVNGAFALAPEILRMELVTQFPGEPKSLSELAENAVAVGFKAGRKLRWSKFELNMFLVWYTILFELERFGDEGKPALGPSKDEEAV